MGEIVKMKNNNGLGTSDKNSLELAARIKSAQIDLDFYSTGLPYSAGVKHSANHLFGNGKWKKAIIDMFGEDALKKYGTYHGNKATDFPLIAFETPYAKYFNPGEKILIKDKTGLYHDVEAKVSSILDKDKIMVIVPFKQNAELSNGVIMNQSRIKGASDAIARFSQMVTDGMVHVASIPNITAQPNVVTNQTLHTNISPETEEPETVQTQNNTNEEPKSPSKALIVFVLALLAIGIGYVIYKSYKPQLKS